MQVVSKTLHGEGDRLGDCYRACVASLLDLPTGEVPHFTEEAERADPDVGHHGAWGAANRWLKPRGFVLVYVRVELGVLLAPMGVVCIAHGQSPRGDFGHSVLWCPALAEIVHDPHPSRDGIVGLPERGLEFLVPIATMHQRIREVTP